MCRCVVRFGYKDIYGSGDEDEFENEFLYNFLEFIQMEGLVLWIVFSNEMLLDGCMIVMGVFGVSFVVFNIGLLFFFLEIQIERENIYNFNFNVDSLEVSLLIFICCNLL